MSLTTSRVWIYIALIVLILALMYIKNKNDLLEEEGQSEHFYSTFVDTAVNIKVTSGPNVGLIVNNTDLLAPLSSADKKEDAIYLAYLKIDGTPRIVTSYATGSSMVDDDNLYTDLQNEFDPLKGAEMLSDKYIVLFSKGAAFDKLSVTTKNFIKENMKSDKIFDINAATSYIFIYDPLDNNVRVEQAGVSGETIIYKNILYSAKRDVAFNKDGLMISGLQCYLDSTRKESYQPSFGTTWKDISGRGRDFNWEKTPLHGDGKFLSTKYTCGSAKGPTCDSFELDDGSKGYAIVMCAKTNSLLQGNSFIAKGKPNAYGIQAHTPWPDGNVYFDQAWDEPSMFGQNRINTQVGPCSEDMYVWIFVRDYNGAMKIYRNGSLLVSNNPGNASPLDLASVPFVLCNNYDANISKFLIYNTFLTADDVVGVTNWIKKDEETQRINRMKQQEIRVPQNIPVRRGLQLLLDANNYEEGSTDWKDQSGNNYDFKWNKAPTVDSKSFLLNGEYALSKNPSRLLNIDCSDYYTICWLAKTNSLSYNSVFKIKGNHTSSRAIFCHPTWVDNTIYYDQAGCCEPSTQRVYGSIGGISDEYAFYTIRKTKNERAIFVNGKRLVVQNTTGDPINVNIEPMIIGRDLEDNYTWFANLRMFMVYNRDLSDAEITKLFNRYYTKYDFGNYSYTDADTFCRKQGKKLCKTDDYCVNDKPAYLIDEEDKWAPIGDYPDGWIQLGMNGDTCKTFKQKCQVTKTATCDNNNNPTWSNMIDREVGVLCCDVKYQPLIINSVFVENIPGTELTAEEKVLGHSKNILNNKLTFFKDDIFQTITPTGSTEVTKTTEFPGITPNFQKGSIDAIIWFGKDRTLWFKGKYVMKYINSTKQGSEDIISKYISKLPEYFAGGFIDTAAMYTTANGSYSVVMFKKNRYCIVDVSNDTMISTESGMIKDKYKSLPKDFASGYLDCAMTSSLEYAYLVKNDKYIRYNFGNNSLVDGPFPISNTFDKLLPPFTSKAGVCKVYENIVKLYANDVSGRNFWNKKYYKQCKRIAKNEYEINVDNYKKLVTKYGDDLAKEKGDLKEIQSKLTAYEKALTDKKNEYIQLEQKYLDVKMTPCKADDVCSNKSIDIPNCKVAAPVVPKPTPGKKQIIIKEYDDTPAPRAFTDVNTTRMENCFYDPNIGSEYTDGFKFTAHTKASDYIDSSKIKNISDFNINDYPGIEKYILKKYVPVRKTGKDFDIKDHPDYYKYSETAEAKPSTSTSSSSSAPVVSAPVVSAPIATSTTKVESFENYVEPKKKASLLEEAKASLKMASSVVKDRNTELLIATNKCKSVKDHSEKDKIAKEYKIAIEKANKAKSSYDVAKESVRVAKELEETQKKEQEKKKQEQSKIDEEKEQEKKKQEKSKVDEKKEKEKSKVDEKKEKANTDKSANKIVKSANLDMIIKTNKLKKAHNEVAEKTIKINEVDSAFETAKLKVMAALEDSKNIHKKTEDAKEAIRVAVEEMKKCDSEYQRSKKEKDVKKNKDKLELVNKENQKTEKKVNKLMTGIEESKKEKKQMLKSLDESKMDVTKATANHITSIKAARVLQVSTNYVVGKEKLDELNKQLRNTKKRILEANKTEDSKLLKKEIDKLEKEIQVAKRSLQKNQEEFQKEMASFEKHKDVMINAQEKNTAASNSEAEHVLSKFETAKKRLHTANMKKQKQMILDDSKKDLKKVEKVVKAADKDLENTKKEAQETLKDQAKAQQSEKEIKEYFSNIISLLPGN